MSESVERCGVFIVSNVRLYRDGISSMLSRAGTIQVVGASDQPEAAAALRALRPDIVLLDALLPELAAAVRAVHAASPLSKVVAFAVADLDAQAVPCAEAGVAAFVDCNASSRDLIAAIGQARRGEFAASPRIAALLLGRVAELARFRPADSRPAPPLTRREQQIVPMLEQGLSNKEIARALSIEASTIKNHVHNILDKLQLRRRGQISARLRD